MSIGNNRLFLLNTIGPLVGNRNLTPYQIYSFYHQKIAQKQKEELRKFNFVFNILDQAGRKIDVVTEDPDEIKKKIEKLKLLSEIDKQIRDGLFKNDADFLSALITTFNYDKIA
jgi:hypothetical protein